MGVAWISIVEIDIAVDVGLMEWRGMGTDCCGMVERDAIGVGIEVEITVGVGVAVGGKEKEMASSVVVAIGADEVFTLADFPACPCCRVIRGVGAEE